MRALFISLVAIVFSGCGDATDRTKSNVSVAMSPCQCMMAGGCGITWTPKDGMLYSDKTSPEDYDDWGFYHGDVKVPKKCMGEME